MQTIILRNEKWKMENISGLKGSNKEKGVVKNHFILEQILNKKDNQTLRSLQPI